MVGAKSAKILRSLRGRNWVFRIDERTLAVVYVVMAIINDKQACRPDIFGFRNCNIKSLKASYMKMTDINEENISSVNFVKYSIRFEVEKNAEI